MIGRWTSEAKRRLSHEKGAIFKDWGGRIPVALIYPNSYYIGMSNLGFQTIYNFFNRDKRFVCERVFWEDLAAKQRGSSTAQPLSLESQRPLSDFAVLAFSISFELDYFNVVQLIRSAGIPLHSHERDKSHPLVIAGGPCVFTNPEPLAPFFDALAIGEGEVILPSFMDALHQGIHHPRDRLLGTLAELPGVYVPGANCAQRVARQWVHNIDSFATTSVILTPETELGDMFTIEIARGCGRGCRFCMAGYLFRPMRPRSLRTLLGQAEEGLKLTNRVGLLGAAVADHPHLEELVGGLHQMGAKVSLSSLRADSLSDNLLKALDKGKARNITVAPETGTERLRRVINKGLSEEKILEAFEKVGRFRFQQLKLYFMVGLPTETDEDIQGIIHLVSRGKDILERLQTPTRIILDISPFVPKPFTAFQWLPMAPVEIINARIESIRKSLQPKGIKVHANSPQWGSVQCILSRGGRELANVLEKLPANSPSIWHKAMEECGLDWNSYVSNYFPLGEALPWDSVDSGISSEFLKAEMERSQRHKEFPVCPPSGCHACGVC
ncbi:MAG: radical SAM protein [Chloroflexi bacterium]|nr:radical SAM protein [Chloroflexota bacterium]